MASSCLLNLDSLDSVPTIASRVDDDCVSIHRGDIGAGSAKARASRHQILMLDRTRDGVVRLVRNGMCRDSRNCKTAVSVGW